ncbi:MAG: hypothetical protein AB1485_06590 [Candidatus Thermoplasmatota archaeon]
MKENTVETTKQIGKQFGDITPILYTFMLILIFGLAQFDVVFNMVRCDYGKVRTGFINGLYIGIRGARARFVYGLMESNRKRW